MGQVVLHPLISKSLEKNYEQKEMPIADSKFLQHVKYDAENLQMTVTMKNGAQYQYFGVYPDIMEQFEKSPNKGQFYSEFVRSKHESTRTINKTVGKAVPQRVKAKRSPHEPKRST